MANRRLGGTAYLTIDGTNVALVGDFEWEPGSVKRETKTGMDGVHGFTEAPNPGSISATVRDLQGVSTTAFNNLVNVTVVVELNSGKTITGRNMWTTEPQRVKSNEATFDLKFEGPAGCVTER
jgi:hypothetical protein